MKSILLTTTALVAFAGAAVAEVTFYGDATLGYNDDGDLPTGFTGTQIGDNQGFYWEGTLGVNLSQELDNGVTAGAVFEADFVDTATGNGQDLVSGDFVLSLTTENAGLYFGDTPFAAETRWSGAGDMEADGFSEADGETALRGDISYGDIEASISYVIANNEGNVNVSEDLNQLSLGVAGSFGNFGFTAAYQAESNEDDNFYKASGGLAGVGGADNGDFSNDEIFGVSVNTTFSGATVTLAYASNETADENSLGVQVAYPFGPVTATVYYVAEDDGSDEDNYGVTLAYAEGPLSVRLDYDYDQGANIIELDGSYDLGNGLTLLAGVHDRSDDAGAPINGVSRNGTDFYVAGVYDLGSGAELLVAYADAEIAGSIDDDEVGRPDYQVGTTVEVSFKF
ncbi:MULTISPECIES: porin [unclassified Yoonia]|uniref:porin n=1 Tax=unclassified Yoonia TaxID=2629118 RepID=UPI002AFF9F31|nr:MULTISPECIES: porin [unclassified Yoonia]